MRQDIASLQERFMAAQKALEELKTKQPTAGDGWVVYRSTTGVGVWDIDLNNVSASYDRLFRITHVPDDGDTSDGFALFYGQFDYATMNNLTYGSVYKDAADPYSWYVRIYGAGGAGSKFRAKFFVFSPKKGTLNITNSAP
jgi:hypothetical protein